MKTRIRKTERNGDKRQTLNEKPEKKLRKFRKDKFNELYNKNSEDNEIKEEEGNLNYWIDNVMKISSKKMKDDVRNTEKEKAAGSNVTSANLIAAAGPTGM